MTRLIRHRHRAMATQFEIFLTEREAIRAQGLAEAVFQEIDRIEGLLSRFNPSSEVHRLNRLAPKESVSVSPELFDLVGRCQRYWKKTGGAFDPAGCDPERLSDFGQVELVSANRTVGFHHPDLVLDFGGVGKGYALLRCREVLLDLGADNLLLHGGTSSVLAMGLGPAEKGWRVDLRDSRETEFLILKNQSLSSSAVKAPDAEDSDLIDPTRKKRLTVPLTCTVIGEDPVVAEILSTAFLVLGREGAREYLEKYPEENVQVVWGRLKS